MKNLRVLLLLTAALFCIVGVQAAIRQTQRPGHPEFPDNVYTGDFMQFGITNTYGEIMPYQYPVGNEHLMVGTYRCGYTLSYLEAGEEYLAYAIYFERQNMSTGSYEEWFDPGSITVRTINQTANHAINLEQNFFFPTREKFIILEVLISNEGTSVAEDFIYKICADWDIDGIYENNWDYDSSMVIPYAYETHYCSVSPIFPNPDIIDYEGWDDCQQRYTDGEVPPQYIENWDGSELMHYELGDLAPGQTAYLALVFASGDDPDDLALQVQAARAFASGSGTLWGYVYGTDSMPLEGAVVSSEFYALSDTTSADGYYCFDRMPAGNNSMTASCVGYYDSTQAVHVAENDSTRHDFYLAQINPAALNLTLTPYGIPIILPASGGSFDYNLAVENTTPAAQVGDCWYYIVLPGTGMVGPVLLAENLAVPGNTTMNRDRTQVIPMAAPAGIYTYHGCVGDYPWVVWDEDSFTFEKLGTQGDNGAWVPGDWLCYGEPFNSSSTAVAATPARAELKCTMIPNPFNPTTTIRLELPEAGWVKVEVFDVKGRSVWAHSRAPLQMAAGTHEITFDGSALPSGIYFVRLTTGEYEAVQKMVLMK